MRASSIPALGRGAGLFLGSGAGLEPLPRAPQGAASQGSFEPQLTLQCDAVRAAL